MSRNITSTDKYFLIACIDLAEEALRAGDKPFGSILVNKAGNILAQARNKVNTLNALAHPELYGLWITSQKKNAKTALYTPVVNIAPCVQVLTAWPELALLCMQPLDNN